MTNKFWEGPGLHKMGNASETTPKNQGLVIEHWNSSRAKLIWRYECCAGIIIGDLMQINCGVEVGLTRDRDAISSLRGPCIS